ncbi:MAG: ATP-binding cassette domain-containing protein, partial [Clostridiales bacterium]|nr:ATP-binding cassette domain-containing protein [Clostridiales bacterium]
YTDMVIPYTLSWENPMSMYTTLINNIYLFILPVGIFIGMNTADYTSYAIGFIFYLVFVPAIAGILMKVLYVNSDVTRIFNGVEAMDKILAEPELKQPVSPKTVDSFSVEFQQVEFSYQKEDVGKALDGVSFVANQGDITAIVGPSGSGKSTIAHLTPRFFDVDYGKILIGGVDVREFSPNYLMENVSFVFQDVFLFKQSIYDNIAMGNPLATKLEIENAAKAAQCHEFITKLPNGYQTIIGTKGVHLSGGEQQRLAIARAIVKNAPIVVLDEATAFADPENEHLIQKAFEVLMKNKTVIIIAHRLSTVRNANKIIVMDKGRVAEEGTHDELVSSEGRYAAMWKTYNTTSSWVMNDKEA